MSNTEMSLSEDRKTTRPLVCVQGVGFVGAAMSVAVASAKDQQGNPRFDVIGVDLPTPEGQARIAALNDGLFPFETTDQSLTDALIDAHRAGNLRATTDPAVYERASVVVVDVHCDISGIADGKPRMELDGIRRAVEELGNRLPPGALVIVETTVPPGTCARIVAPILENCLQRRGLPSDAILLAHAYERVMPGPAYLDSVVRFWRVYAGHTPEAADACEAFLSQVVDVEHFPLTRLSSTTASETGKVLENSYRAMTIAFMEEWGRYAEAVGIDLFEVIDAIRVRPTHSNMRQPGFGVGGYCLTKDPLFAQLGARELFGVSDLSFPFCTTAIDLNRAMPLVTLRKVEHMLGGSLAGKTILLMGVSYRSDVGDTRYSPSETFAREASARGARLICHDPLVSHWAEMDMPVLKDLPTLDGVDVIVFTVGHRDYHQLSLTEWLADQDVAVFDANNVLSRVQRDELRRLGTRTQYIGRGEAIA